MGLFWKREWKRLPPSFVSALEERLGSESFATLTALARRYKLFGQMAANAEIGADNETRMDQVARFLTSVGNELARNAVIEGPRMWDDAIQVFQIALSMKPDHVPARSSLAWTLQLMGRREEAVQEATRALADMEAPEKTVEEARQASLADPHGSDARAREMVELFDQAREQMRETMQAIINGTAPMP